jgi:hypothetical protein
MRFKQESKLWRTLTEEALTLEDVKALFKLAGHREDDPDRVAYANSLVPEAGDYLRPYELRALIRADISETEAAVETARHKAFFSRLVELLPSLLEFFETRENLAGLLYHIDDCHNEFLHTATSPRRDRQARQTKEMLTQAREATDRAAAALESTKKIVDSGYAAYSAACYGDTEPSRERPRFEKLLEELRLCSGVFEIMAAMVDLSPTRDPFTLLHLSGNDQRTLVVESAYHMTVDWKGPKLVTTPGSQFAILCSLLFEAVSGTADESLSGAINRYARSDDRRVWETEGEELEDEDDNFQIEKQIMSGCNRQIDICKALQNSPGLSALAESLLLMRIDWEQQNHERAKETYGPRQVYVENYNREQVAELFAPILSRLDPKKLETLYSDGLTTNGLSALAHEMLTGSDISVGKARRSGRLPDVDG